MEEYEACTLGILVDLESRENMPKVYGYSTLVINYWLIKNVKFSTKLIFYYIHIKELSKQLDELFFIKSLKNIVITEVFRTLYSIIKVNCDKEKSPIRLNFVTILFSCIEEAPDLKS